MSFLEDMAGKEIGSMTNSSNPLVASVMQMINNHPGGIPGLVQRFDEKGLGGLVSSWVSTGQNQSITPDQLHQGLGADRVRELAKHAGLSEGDAASALSGLLPMVVDKLTPNGSVPSASELPQLLNALKGFLG